MSEVQLKLSPPPTEAEIAQLQTALRGVAQVAEQPAQSYDFNTLVVTITVVAATLQTADILSNWIIDYLKQQAQPANELTLRLRDGRTVKLETNGDPQKFVEQVRAVLEKM